MAKDYTKWKREDLLKEIEQLKKRKKYGLVWEEKAEDVVEQCKKELPVFEEVKENEIITDKNKPVNILIEGDNFHALSVLNYTHKGKIDVIYIDPPYNTGARDWKYNNNFVDEEDPYRHTKWLSFMSHRLRISKELLAKDGIICVTIDDYEIPRLWLLMEEIFGEVNFLGALAIRINPGGRKSKRKIAAQHEYALYFSRTAKTSVAKIYKDPSEKSHSYKQDTNGEWYEKRNLRKEGADSLAKPDSERYYPIYFDPNTGKVSTKEKLKVEIWPIDTKKERRIWRRSKEVIDDMYNNNEIFIQETKYGPQVYFKFKGGLKGETPKSFWDDVRYSASEHGTQKLDLILGKREMFNFPKSPYATEDCIRVATSKKNAIILDFFAGSGTTGQAVLELNKKDDGDRTFILCTNNESHIAEDVCYPRLKNVMKGYKFSGSEKTKLYEKKITENFIDEADLIADELHNIRNVQGSKYKSINLKIEENSVRLYGINNFNKTKDGYGGNLKYFKTSFVPAEATDKNKVLLTKKAIDMLCMKEGTYEPVVTNKDFLVFKNKEKYTGILLNPVLIANFIKEIQLIPKMITVYIFTLSDDILEDEFSIIKDKVILLPIPEAILRVYRRLFK